MSNKQPTRTIYNCLGSAFWTQRKKNYQLSFLEVLTVEQYCSEVIVQLQHQPCLLTCSFNYQKDIICNQEIKKWK